MNFFKEISTKAKVWGRERHRWSAVKTGSSPRVFYGFDNIGSRESVVTGGIVKVQDLQKIFPNCTETPNLLYLVSSSMPPYAPLMAEMAKRHGARFVLNQNGVAYPAWHGAGWEKTNVSNRLLVQSADHVIYQSHFCKNAADRFLGTCRGSWEILHNPVDTRSFRPSPVLPRTPLILLQAGTHGCFYRVETAVRTLHELNKRGVDVRLLIAGRYNWRPRESDALAELNELAQSLGVALLMDCRGAYSQNEAVRLFQSAHILLHTQYNDCCPRLVVEAMASGLPVVYSSSGGTPELVGNEGGVGVPVELSWERAIPPGVKELADAVIQVYETYGKYSASALDRSRRLFDVEKWMDRHDKMFKSYFL